MNVLPFVEHFVQEREELLRESETQKASVDRDLVFETKPVSSRSVGSERRSMDALDLDRRCGNFEFKLVCEPLRPGVEFPGEIPVTPIRDGFFVFAKNEVYLFRGLVFVLLNFLPLRYIPQHGFKY